jgi:hypothetical protein
MRGSVIRSLYTREWKIWIEPSSEAEAKRGYVGWKWRERIAREWYLSNCQKCVRIDGPWVNVLHDLVWLFAQLEIEPTELAVITTND